MKDGSKHSIYSTTHEINRKIEAFLLKVNCIIDSKKDSMQNISFNGVNESSVEFNNNDDSKRQGTEEYDDGSIYTGEFQNGERHGKGTYEFSSGDKYSGDWKNGTQNGQGTFEFSCGSVYIGNWRDGERNGKGTLKLANGDIYIGNWKNDKMHSPLFSTEICEFASGDKFECNFHDGSLNEGIDVTVNYADGSKYLGRVNKDWERHGEGQMWYADNPNVSVWGIWEKNEFIRALK